MGRKEETWERRRKFWKKRHSLQLPTPTDTALVPLPTAGSHDGGRRRRPRRHFVHTSADNSSRSRSRNLGEQQKNIPGLKLRFGTYRHGPESWPLERRLYLPLSTVQIALTLRHRLNGSGERPGWHKGDEAGLVAQLAGRKGACEKAFYSNAIRGSDWLFF